MSVPKYHSFNFVLSNCTFVQNNQKKKIGQYVCKNNGKAQTLNSLDWPKTWIALFQIGFVDDNMFKLGLINYCLALRISH